MKKLSSYSKLSILLCYLALLSGCATVSEHTKKPITPTTALSQQAHNTKLAELSHWKAEGKMGASNGTDGASASFIWEQAGPDYKIKFFGPLGMGSAHLYGNTETKQVRLKESNGKITVANSPEELVYKATKLVLPVSGLHYWIKGLPQPNQPIQYRILNDAGLLKQISQNGWEIQYFNYVDTHRNKPKEPALFLPSKLKIRNSAVHVTLVISSWEEGRHGDRPLR